MPNRISVWNQERTFYEGDKWYQKTLEEPTAEGINYIQYPYHPSMYYFFNDYYKQRIRDAFIPKYFTYKYVEDELGFSYYTLLKKVYRLNKSRFDSIHKKMIKGLFKKMFTCPECNK
jgi:hypothetical protein